MLGNRPDLGRGGAITFHSLEYSKITNIGLKEIVGFGLKWPDTSITTNNIHLMRRGTWTLSYSLDPMSSIEDADNATYYPILPSYYLGDPQTDGQENVPTEIYFSFNISYSSK